MLRTRQITTIRLCGWLPLTAWLKLCVGVEIATVCNWWGMPLVGATAYSIHFRCRGKASIVDHSRAENSRPIPLFFITRDPNVRSLSDGCARLRTIREKSGKTTEKFAGIGTRQRLKIIHVKKQRKKRSGDKRTLHSSAIRASVFKAVVMTLVGRRA